MLGRLASSINGTKNLPREVENNLVLIRNSSILSDTHCASSTLYSFICDLQGYGTKCSILSKNSRRQKLTSIVDENNTQELFLKFGKEVIFYDKYVVKGATLTTLNYSKSKQFQDCALLYKRENEFYFGLIKKIILITTSNNVILQIIPLSNSRKDEVLLNFDAEKIVCDHVEYGTIDFNHHIHISGNDFVEKVSFFQLQTRFIFVRYPTLNESS